MPLPCGVTEIAKSLHVEIQAAVVTVRQFEVSSRVCSRFNPLTVSGLNLLHTQGFAAILEDGSVLTWGDPGRGGDSSAVRGQLKGVQQIQSTYCKWIESAAHPGLLLRFWKMDPSLLGEIQAAVVTVRQFEVSSRVCSRFNPLTTISGLNLLHAQGFCCDSGRWIRPYLGRSRPRWWQFGSSRSAQGCAADSIHLL